MGKKNRRHHHSGGGSVSTSGASGHRGRGDNGQHLRGSGGSSKHGNGNAGGHPKHSLMEDGEDPYSLYAWLKYEESAMYYILAFCMCGWLIGFGIGSGHLTGAYFGGTTGRGSQAARWRQALGRSVRASSAYVTIHDWATFSTTPKINPLKPQVQKVPNPNEYKAPPEDQAGSSGSSSGSKPPTMQPTIAPVTKSTIASSSASQSAMPTISPRDEDEDSTLFSASRKRGSFFSRLFSSTPTHAHDSPHAFAALREMIIREDGGYVHPDLGFLNPAPCGAARGIGMVRDSYTNCQRRCTPGTLYDFRRYQIEMLRNDQFWESLAPEHQMLRFQEENTYWSHEKGRIEYLTWDQMTPGQRLDSRERELDCSLGPIVYHSRFQKGFIPRFNQTEVLIKIPLSIQMTREVSLETLGPLLPPDVARHSPLEELDDGILLALLLSHERGVGRDSWWYPYIATLPPEPLCGYWPAHRSAAFDAITTLGLDIGMDVNGWPGELLKASEYANRIANALARDYGEYMTTIEGETPQSSISWAMCHVFSRAIGGKSEHGALRLIPMLDMVNHYRYADEYDELTGKESYDNDDFIHAHEEDDQGALVLRNRLYGRHEELRKGQELLANYNVKQYPLDWFVNLGFVPQERMARWKRLESAFPKRTGETKSKLSPKKKQPKQPQNVQQSPPQSQQPPAIKDSAKTSEDTWEFAASAGGGKPKRIVINIGGKRKKDKVFEGLASLLSNTKEDLRKQKKNILAEEQRTGQKNELARKEFFRLKNVAKTIKQAQELYQETVPLMASVEQLNTQRAGLVRSHAQYAKITKHIDEELVTNQGRLQQINTKLDRLKKVLPIQQGTEIASLEGSDNINWLDSLVDERYVIEQEVTSHTMTEKVPSQETQASASVELKPDGTLEIKDLSFGATKDDGMVRSLVEAFMTEHNEQGKKILRIRVNGQEWKDSS